ncbi:MAG: protein-L-isoaspartate(D-aspartate) O-methyltransferase [Phycisphaerales bacterium]|nr:protein-L-isoaspartate(D-aspartate) O-methyltransferase [Phycisphaerales bacterium]
MVRRQIADPPDIRKAVADETVLEALRTVPRHVFVPEKLRNRAYDDTPLPIGHGQTISQPYIVAFMTEVLQLEPGDRVLEIGTGSGYQAAVLGQLTPNVFTIEIIEPLAKTAGRVLKEQGYTDIKWKHGDGYYGWEEHAPFDAIIVTAAAGHVPPPLWEQLAPGGKMVIPVGGRYEVQRLIFLEKTQEGERRSRSLMAVRFVPLTGDLGEDEDD